jgi:hypothetical protein
MVETNVVKLPEQRRPRIAKTGDGQLAAAIKKAYHKLICTIEDATTAGLEVRVILDSSDTYGGGRVRGREIEIKRKL